MATGAAHPELAGAAAAAADSGGAAAAEHLADVTERSTAASSAAVVADSDQTTTLLLSLLVPLAIIVLYLLFGRSGSGGRSGGRRKLVLFGPVGAGKSAIYHRLRFGRVVPTVSSMMTASATFAPTGSAGGSKPAHVVDVPGSGRLRAQLIEEASGAGALVCVIDATQLAAQAREAAGMLFEVLSLDSVVRGRPPLLIAVNKQDCSGAASAAAARKALEQEVQRVRLARTTMADTSGRAKALKGIADDSSGEPFSFDDIGSAVTFAGTSATKPDLEPLLEHFGLLR